MPTLAHAQIGHFRAPIYLGIGWVSVLLNVNIVKQGHTKFISEGNELDHDSIGLFMQLKSNIAPAMHVCSITLSFAVDKSG